MTLTREDRRALSAATSERHTALAEWKTLLSETAFLDISPNTQRLAPLIYHNLRKTSSLPERNRLRGAYKHTWAKNLGQLTSFLPVIDDLQASGINYRVIKGVAIQLATGLLGSRVVGDIDVVIKASDLEATVAVLEKRGFQCHTRARCGFHAQGFPEGALGFNQGEHHIDLHVAERKDPSRLLVWMLETPPIFHPIRSSQIAIPPAESLILHSSLHGHRGEAETDLIQALCDITLLQPLSSRHAVRHLATRTRTWREWKTTQVRLRNLAERGEVSKGESPRKHRTSRSAPTLPLLARLPRAARLIKQRNIGLKSLFTVARQAPGRRFSYGLWLLLGRFAEIERFLLTRRGFLPAPTAALIPGISIQPFMAASAGGCTYSSPVTQLTGDFRFALRLPPTAFKGALTLQSRYFEDIAIAVYLDGFKVSKIVSGDTQSHTFSLRHAGTVCEISLRYPHQTCSACFRTLNDLTIFYTLDPQDSTHNALPVKDEPVNRHESL